MKVFKQYGRSSILALMILIFAWSFGSTSHAQSDSEPEMTSEQRQARDEQLTKAEYEKVKSKAAEQAKTAASATAAAPATADTPKPKNGSPDCIDAGETARKLCNTMSMVGVSDPAQGAMMEMMMNQAMGMASQIQSAGANGAQQCSNQAKLSELMAGINGIKAAACMFGQQRCESRCQTATDELKPIVQRTADAVASEKAKKDTAANERTVGTCKQYTINTMMAAMQAVKFGGSMLQNQACAAALSQTPINPALAGITLPTGGTDCSDPAMASSNVSCICAVNPTATICGGAAGGTQLGGVPGGGMGSMGPGSVARPYSDNSTTDGVPVSGLGTPKAENGVAAAGGGGSGGGIGGGGSGSGAPGGEDQGGAAAVDKQSMIGGVSNGGGGGSGSAGNPNGSNNASGDKGFFDKFNLSKFLPSKKNFGSRGLAGMSVQSKDGITGPMGPSLWEKVTNQYQVQKPKMIQDR